MEDMEHRKEMTDAERREGIARLLSQAYISLARKRGKLRQFEQSGESLALKESRYEFLQ